jgi:hypothetical protein
VFDQLLPCTGELQEPSKKAVSRLIEAQDAEVEQAKNQDSAGSK